MFQLLAAKPCITSDEVALKARIDFLVTQQGRPPKIVVVIVGDDPASHVYVNQKARRAIALGMQSETLKFPVSASPSEVYQAVCRLNQSEEIDGILIQRPLPPHFREEEVLTWVDPEKDVDAFHPMNAGKLFLGQEAFRPCTPFGVMRLLQYYGIRVDGSLSCVVGRSSIVGKPMGQLLLQANSTVIQAHSKTQDLKSLTRQCDLVVVAAGKPHLLGQDHFKKGATVVDVGIHRGKDGKLLGDVDPKGLETHLTGLTPVPGGVGPMTIHVLMANTITAMEKRLKK